MVALVIEGQCFDRCRHIALQAHIVHPVTGILQQLHLALHRGIPAVKHRHHHLNHAVFMGHLYSVELLRHDIGKREILKLFSLLPRIVHLLPYDRNFLRTLSVIGRLCSGDRLSGSVCGNLARVRASLSHPVKAVKTELSVFIHCKIFGKNHIAEIIDKIRNRHDTVGILNPILPPLYHVIQFIDNRDRAALVCSNLSCIFRDIDPL